MSEGEAVAVEEKVTSALPKSVQWAVAWLLILSSIFIVNTIVMLFGLHIFALSLPMCIIIALVLLQWSSRASQRPMQKSQLIKMGLVFLLAVILIGYFVALIWEYSFWGRGYFTEAIVALTKGWNPIYDGAHGLSELAYRSTKAVWYVDASIYSFLGHYEMAKSHTLLFAVPTFLLTRHCFEHLLDGKKRLATTLTVLSILNPVALSQVFTFYDDAVLAYAIQCFLVLVYLIVNEGYLHKDLLLTLSFLWIFIFHMQLEGLRAAFILAIAFGILMIFYFKKEAIRWLSIRFGIVVLTAMTIVGFNPIMQNLLDRGNPFYIYIGEHAVHQAEEFMPVLLEGETWLGKFITSTFASPDPEMFHQNIILQQLTAIIHTCYAQPDVYLRGFGFFGGILILIALIFLVIAMFLPKYRAECETAVYLENGQEEISMTDDYMGIRAALLWFIIPIIAIALFTSTIWWARTVAILWLLIPLAIIALNKGKKNGKSFFAKLLLILAFTNCALVGASVVPTAVSYTNNMKGYWQRMSTEELPSAEDAKIHNEYITQFKSWQKLKAKGEADQEKKAVWTKIEGLVK